MYGSQTIIQTYSYIISHTCQAVFIICRSVPEPDFLFGSDIRPLEPIRVAMFHVEDAQQWLTESRREIYG